MKMITVNLKLSDWVTKEVSENELQSYLNQGWEVTRSEISKPFKIFVYDWMQRFSRKQLNLKQIRRLWCSFKEKQI